MANELVHATVGTSLTQLEFEAVGLHVLNSQATGDLIYATSGTQLSRLGIGSTNKVLTVIGGVPTWQSTLAGLTLTSPTINGTIATTGLTLPSFTVTRDISSLTSDSFNLIAKYQGVADTAFNIYTTGASAGYADTVRLSIGCGAATGVKATWGAATVQVGLVLGGNMTVTGYAFDAGAGSAQINTTGGSSGLTIQSTQDAATGARLTLLTLSASPDVNDITGDVVFVGKNDAAGNVWYAEMRGYITDKAAATATGRFEWWLRNSNASNQAMTLSGAGGLAVDLDNGGTDYYVGLFDEYDDALVIKQGIQENNRELLANIGVLDRKDTGSGYMMKIQPMIRLLAGGIYQGRKLIDDTREELVERIETLENKLMLLEG